MQRRPTTQDITWILDLHRNKQLNLDPPYQRRSVWTKKDRQYFLDTIFRNFPSPAIFLHKTISDDGKSTYHMVDGKQRTQTILDFVGDKIRIANDFGDIRLNGKKWSDLQGESDLKQKLWNYQVTVEMIDFPEGSFIVNEIFDRLNRNARKLTPQELRHAKFDGWLIGLAESESENAVWRTFGVVTHSRSKRMIDSQFISELLLVILEKKILGFDQDNLDEMYAKYDDIQESDSQIVEEEFKERLEKTKKYLLEVQRKNNSITDFANSFANFYTVWSVVALNNNELPNPDIFAERYLSFMKHVEALSKQDDFTQLINSLNNSEKDKYNSAMTYLTNTRGASTDQKPREIRYRELKKAIIYT